VESFRKICQYYLCDFFVILSRIISVWQNHSRDKDVGMELGFTIQPSEFGKATIISSKMFEVF
jgi:hypothetical protein